MGRISNRHKFLLSKVYTKGDTISPGLQGFCARISDNAPPKWLPKQYAYISFGTVPIVPISAHTLREDSESFVAGFSSERRVRAHTSAIQDLWCLPPLLRT